MNKTRLLKLARFLESLPPESFNFSDVVSKSTESCGSVCCAIGWTPKVFPKLIKWYRRASLAKLGLMMGDCDVDYIMAGKNLFDITFQESRKLFSPSQTLSWWVGKNIGAAGKPEEVALSIRKFIEWKETEECISV